MTRPSASRASVHGAHDALEVLLDGPRADVVRLGLALPLTGPLALTVPSALDLAGLAVDEVNEAGGVEGRHLEWVLVDSGRPPAAVTTELLGLSPGLDGLVGFHTTDVHRRLEAALSGRLPYVFTPPHEGGRGRPGVRRLGHDPLTQHATALRWLVERRHARRWVLLGTDYVWPRRVHAAARAVLGEFGAEVVGEALVPFGPVDPAPLIDLVRSRRADAVLLSLIGRDLVAFHRAFTRSGLHRSVVRLSGALEENGLYALGGDRTGELYACMPSFAAADGSADDDQLALQERHLRRSGPSAPVVCAYARGVHDGVREAAALLAGRAVDRGRARPRLARADGLVFREVPVGPPR